MPRSTLLAVTFLRCSKIQTISEASIEAALPEVVKLVGEDKLESERHPLREQPVRVQMQAPGGAERSREGLNCSHDEELPENQKSWRIEATKYSRNPPGGRWL